MILLVVQVQRLLVASIPSLGLRDVNLAGVLGWLWPRARPPLPTGAWLWLRSLTLCQVLGFRPHGCCCARATGTSRVQTLCPLLPAASWRSPSACRASSSTSPLPTHLLLGGLLSRAPDLADSIPPAHPAGDALEKEMATHSSVLAWRIPGLGEPGGLPSLGSHRVRHN